MKPRGELFWLSFPKEKLFRMEYRLSYGHDSLYMIYGWVQENKSGQFEAWIPTGDPVDVGNRRVGYFNNQDEAKEAVLNNQKEVLPI